MKKPSGASFRLRRVIDKVDRLYKSVAAVLRAAEGDCEYYKNVSSKYRDMFIALDSLKFDIEVGYIPSLTTVRRDYKRNARKGDKR